MKRMRFLRHIARDEKGATAIEYAFLAALIAVAIVASVREIGLTLSVSFEAADTAFSTATDETDGTE